MCTQNELDELFRNLQPFIGNRQLQALKMLCKSPDGEWYRNRLNELLQTFNNLPELYSNEELGEQAIIKLHYFTPSSDFYITEIDNEHQIAFGLMHIFEAELGYINVPELVDCNAEIDLHWSEKTITDVKGERGWK